VINKDPHPRGRVVNNAIVVFDLDSARNEVGAAVLKAHFDQGDFIIFTTVLPFTIADETSKRIQEEFPLLPFHDFTMLMRKDGDERSPLELKREYANFIQQYAQKDSLTISHAYDMDPAIVAMYAEFGFPASALTSTSMQAPSAEPRPASMPQPFTDTPEAVRPPPVVINIGKAMIHLFPNGVMLKTEQDINEHLAFISKLAQMIKPEAM
jgi:hypothetical protein